LACTVTSAQIKHVAPYEAAALRAVSFLNAIRREHGITLAELNLGGGHAVAYHGGDVPLDARVIALSLRQVLASACAQWQLPVPRLAVEPGRAIAGPAGLTLYRVISVKRSDARTWVAVDGGLSDNPRPAMYGTRYTTRLLGRLSPLPDTHVTVVGRHCESGDILIEDALLPPDIRGGDLLAVPSTGAYHHSMASTYNLVGRPPIVVVADGRSWPIVRRETTADLLSRDVG
jgi:diaminopimelate decarboxylase